MYRKIIVPLDGSAFAEHALGMATLLAKHSAAEIDLLTVHYPSLFAVDRGAHVDQMLRQEEHGYLARIGAALHDATGAAVRFTIRDGVPADVICEYASWFTDALVIMTTHGRTGFSRAWIGSVADAVMKSSQHPVLMLRPPETPPAWKPSTVAAYHTVLVPLDGSAFAEAALAHGAALAEMGGAKLELLRVVEPPQAVVVPFTAPPFAGVPMLAGETLESVVQHATAYVKNVAERTRDEHPRLTVVTDLLVSESPSRAIVDRAKEHGTDLVAMATHGRGVSRLVVPSVADKVLRGGPDAVLLVKVASD